mmetsp:Transcript_9074/g.14763  ORF Transcript_9074/g.14763 Transcript_9074/m.14763 type:complete len:338 (+) Transcript_9074:2385-3398(+)|eukprot:CAMPEP_0203750390 /NCGR_PEP_ID=MMETSP0098-20131031/4625_1 /ASSEMBLY_ACC=CAM_ASM_000208 /TAXON_ID=96639 /ORGANISM=" , Strain NY0313808BC1" /LENGTH=337 /DNA_ID=CAMNT_0050639657 /DNA_START=1107 /DNA_END=2120 /DNA_ORIENTATION=+
MHEKVASEVLKQWLLSRKSNPYPTPEEKQELMQVTGLNRAQLDHWFTNARQRYVRPKNRRGPNPNYSRYPQNITDMLTAWLTDPKNVNYPYPNPQDQANLMEKTGLTKRQLQNWFTNARKRKLANRLMEPTKQQGAKKKLSKTVSSVSSEPSTDGTGSLESSPVLKSSLAGSLPSLSDLLQQHGLNTMAKLPPQFPTFFPNTEMGSFNPQINNPIGISALPALDVGTVNGYNKMMLLLASNQNMGFTNLPGASYPVPAPSAALLSQLQTFSPGGSNSQTKKRKASMTKGTDSDTVRQLKTAKLDEQSKNPSESRAQHAAALMLNLCSKFEHQPVQVN